MSAKILANENYMDDAFSSIVSNLYDKVKRKSEMSIWGPPELPIKGKNSFTIPDFHATKMIKKETPSENNIPTDVSSRLLFSQRKINRHANANDADDKEIVVSEVQDLESFKKDNDQSLKMGISVKLNNNFFENTRLSADVKYCNEKKQEHNMTDNIQVDVKQVHSCKKLESKLDTKSDAENGDGDAEKFTTVFKQIHADKSSELTKKRKPNYLEFYKKLKDNDISKTNSEFLFEAPHVKDNTIDLNTRTTGAVFLCNKNESKNLYEDETVKFKHESSKSKQKRSYELPPRFRKLKEEEIINPEKLVLGGISSKNRLFSNNSAEETCLMEKNCQNEFDTETINRNEFKNLYEGGTVSNSKCKNQSEGLSPRFRKLKDEEGSIDPEKSNFHEGENTSSSKCNQNQYFELPPRFRKLKHEERSNDPQKPVSRKVHSKNRILCDDSMVKTYQIDENCENKFDTETYNGNDCKKVDEGETISSVKYDESLPPRFRKLKDTEEKIDLKTPVSRKVHSRNKSFSKNSVEEICQKEECSKNSAEYQRKNRHLYAKKKTQSYNDLPKFKELNEESISLAPKKSVSKEVRSKNKLPCEDPVVKTCQKKEKKSYSSESLCSHKKDHLLSAKEKTQLCIRISELEFMADSYAISKIKKALPKLSEDIPDVDTGCKEIPYSAEAVHTVLRFVFSGSFKFVTLSPVTGVEVLAAAQSWNMTDFVELFQKKFFQDVLTPSNARLVFSHAYHYNLKEVCDMCQSLSPNSDFDNPPKKKQKICLVSISTYIEPLEISIPYEPVEREMSFSFKRNIKNNFTFKAVSGCYSIKGFQIQLNEKQLKNEDDVLKIDYSVKNDSEPGEVKRVEKPLRPIIIIYFKKSLTIKPKEECEITVETEVAPYLCSAHEGRRMKIEDSVGKLRLRMKSCIKIPNPDRQLFLVSKFFYHVTNSSENVKKQ